MTKNKPTSLTQLEIIRDRVKSKMVKLWQQGNMAGYERQKAILKHTENKITHFSWQNHLAR